jgi:hypothetical protein
MKRLSLLIILSVFLGQELSAQAFDATVYSHLVRADPNEFIKYAKSVGLTTVFDSTSKTLFANTKGCLYTKPLGDKFTNENYVLVLIVSTLDKENNKLILKNAKENPYKKGNWMDKEYVYFELDWEDPISKEMHYKVFVSKRKK